MFNSQLEQSDKLYQKFQGMNEDYQLYLKKISSNPLLLKKYAKRNTLNQKTFLLTLPAQVYRNSWAPIIERKGFVNAVHNIQRNLRGIIKAILGQNEDKCTFEYILRLILPEIITYKINAKNVQEIFDRVKLLKQKWKLTDKVVGGLTAYFQVAAKKAKGELAQSKLLNDLFLLFNTTESKVDYYYYAFQTLNLAVGATLFELSNESINLEQIYRNMISSQRDSIIVLLNKLNVKHRIATFGKMISQFCQIESNQGYCSKVKKIVGLFLVFNNWHHLKGQNIELKQPMVISLLAQCFHRLLYLLYDADDKTLKLFLTFLELSSIEHYEQIKSKISYHILALFKIKVKLQNPAFCQKLERIWIQKFRDFKLSELYVKQPPSFVNQNQKLPKTMLEQCQTMSVPFMNWSSSLSRKSQSSKSRASKLRARQKHSWLKALEQQLKRFDLQKILLLLQGFRLYYSSEFTQCMPQYQRKTLEVMKTLVAVMKQVTQKLSQRFNPQQLYKAIKMQLAQIISVCSQELVLPESFVQDFGIFQLYYSDTKSLNVQSLVKLHLKYNYQLTLSNLMSIRIIQQDIHQQSSNFKIQHLAIIAEDSFEGRLLLLFKRDLYDGQNKDIKSFVIISKLLAIGSPIITNNLLVNYAFCMFSQDPKEQIAFSEKALNFSVMINQQIIKNTCELRVKVILNMGTIFDSFQSKKTIKSIANSRKYLLFLRNAQHSKYFLHYYQIFKHYNYLIEAIHFLQLYYHRNPSILPSQTTKFELLELYERLNEPFSQNLRYIKKELKLENGQNKIEFKIETIKTLLQIATHSIDNQRGLQSSYNELFADQFPKAEVWLYYYDYVQSFLINSIAQLKVSEQISQKLLIFKIIMAFLTLKLKQGKRINCSQRQIDNLVHMIQKVKNCKDQQMFYQEMLAQLQLQKSFEKVETMYLQLLLKNNKSVLLKGYLKQKSSTQNSQVYQKKYLKYVIRDHFQNKRYIESFAEVREYKQNTSFQISPELHQIQLQSQYNIMMNFTIEDFLSFFKKCTYPPQSKQSTQKHFNYYFKIFRMLFQRYNFTKLIHNQDFLSSYFRFIDKNLVFTENIAYIGEIILYLLRFVLQKFQIFDANSKYAQKIIIKFQGLFIQFVPFCDYLINKISMHQPKNEIIRSLLVIVLSEYPNQSIWTFCFLKNFSCVQKKSSAEQKNQMQVIESIYLKATQLLDKNGKLNRVSVTFLDQLTKAGFKSNPQKKPVDQIKELKLPSGLCYVFDKQYTIQKIKFAENLGNGKSAPLLLTLQISNEKAQHIKDVKVILKCNPECKKYRIESSTANFFYQIGLIDQETTYRIFHLSKYLVMVEYVPNCGTISSVIQSYCSEYNHLLFEINKQLNKRAENPRLKTEKRALEIYDKFAPKITLKTSEILILNNRHIKSFRDWWTTYTNFVRTLAQWSYLGYIIGLGDRHYENILITQKGKLIHIDFQYALDIGLKLGCPQWVPFRLTNFLTEPLGIFKGFGMLYGEMIEVAKKFKESEANVWKAMALFVGFFQTNFTLQLMNRSKFEKYEFNSIQQGIVHLIKSAQNPELLRLMFFGWRSFI